MDSGAEREEVDRLVDAWREDRPEQSTMLDAMRPETREEVLPRLRAVLSASARLQSSEDAAVTIGMKPSRFFQIARAFRTDRSLASLGVRDRLLMKRQSRLPADAAADRDAVITSMRRVLAGRTPPRTEAALSRLAAGPGKRFARSTLLRWWMDEKRARPARSIGSALAADVSPLDLRRSDGGFWSAAFVVDRGANAVLGGAIIEGQTTPGDLREAARDALARVPALNLERSRPASEPRILIETASLDGGASALRLFGGLVGAGVPASKIYEQSEQGPLGRSVRKATGGRLGRVGLLSARATALRGIGEVKVATTVEEARALLKDGIDIHQREVAERQAKLPTAEDDGALDTLMYLLRSITSR